MKRILASACVALLLGACAGDGVSDGPGQVTVNKGLLAGGTPGQGVAASTFTFEGPRVLLAGSVDAGCSLETRLGDPEGTNPVDSATIRLTLAPTLGPGTYEYTADAGAPFAVEYSFTSPYYGGFAGGALSGTLSLTRVDPNLGVEGSYHFDFGGAGISGGVGSNIGSLGELIEDGVFVAPVYDLCGGTPKCGGTVCASDEICSRSCGGDEGTCIPAPSCSGAPSCGDCQVPADVCCDILDGMSLICGCFP